jgi:hypothetical protein
VDNIRIDLGQVGWGDVHNAFTDFNLILFHIAISVIVRWVPVTTAWSVLRLRMEEWPPTMEVAVNILNKQPRTNYKGWSTSLGVEREAKNPSA